MNNKLKYFLIIIVVAFFLAAIIEVISRNILCKIYNRNFDSSLIIDNKYFTSAGLKEKAFGRVWGKQFHTDEFGGRKNATYNKKKKKWLFIGDSVTEGVGVDDTSTFSYLYSKEFSEYNILNMSLIGYSSADYLNVLQSFLQSDTSVELVTLFYCLNDVYGNSKTKDLPEMAKQNFVGKANAFLQDYCATYKLIKLFFYRNSDSYYKYDLQFYSEGNSQFQESMSYLKQCDSICKSKNTFFQVITFPYQSQLRGKKFPPQQLVKQFCQRDSIKSSDASEYLSKQEGANSFYLFADEIHFSEKGHRAIAEFLSQ